MLDNEMKTLWKSINELELISIDKESLNKDVHEHASIMERKILIRNILEIGVAVLMVPVAAFIAYLHPSLLVKAGAILMFPSLFLVIYKLLETRRNKMQAKEFATNLEFLENSLTYYQREKHLLDTVFYWYVLPFIPCVIFVLLGIGLSGFKLI